LAETGKLDEVSFRLQERPWCAEFLPQKLRFEKGKSCLTLRVPALAEIMHAPSRC